MARIILNPRYNLEFILPQTTLYSINHLDELEKHRKSAIEFGDSTDDGTWVVYGRGGGHRYLITYDGNVKFSKGHASRENAKRAEELGFIIYQCF